MNETEPLLSEIKNYTKKRIVWVICWMDTAVGIQQPQVMNGSGAVVLSKQHQQQQQLHHHHQQQQHQQQQQHHHHQQPQTMNAKHVDMLDIPGKGRCLVYIAR